MCMQEIIKDIIPFAFASVLILLGFLLGFLALLNGESTEAGWTSTSTVFSTFNLAMSFDLSQFISAGSFTMFYATIFACIVVLVLMNMVIALMGDTVDQVQDSELGWKLYQRARKIVEQGSMMSESERSDPAKCQPWLHVLRATDHDANPPWSGHVNAVNQRIQSSEKRVMAHVSGIKADIQALQASIDAIAPQHGQTALVANDPQLTADTASLPNIGASLTISGKQSKLETEPEHIWIVAGLSAVASVEAMNVRAICRSKSF